MPFSDKETSSLSCFCNLVHGTPELLFLSADRNDGSVKMPDVARIRRYLTEAACIFVPTFLAQHLMVSQYSNVMRQQTEPPSLLPGRKFHLILIQPL